jgi:hypothetical protein
MSHRTLGGRIRVYAVSIAVLGSALGFAMFARNDVEAAAQEEMPAVDVGEESIHAVAHGTLQAGPVISGSLQPERRATVRAEVSGAVLSTERVPRWSGAGGPARAAGARAGARSGRRLTAGGGGAGPPRTRAVRPV